MGRRHEKGEPTVASEGPVQRQELVGWNKFVVSLVSLGFVGFHVYTAIAGVYRPFVQRGVHLLLLLPLAFVLYPSRKGTSPDRVPGYDLFLAGLAILPSLFIILQSSRIEDRLEQADPVLPIEVVLGALALLLVLEAVRRTVTPVMTGLIVLFIAYLWLGPYLPGILHHRGFSFPRLIELFYLLTGEGLYGVLMGISATYIALFVIFGAFIEMTGAGDFIMDFARAAAGRFTGGPAKIATLSSALFGTLSGSAVANVYATGTFTIPMMKRRGYRAQFAGAVEAVASTGGQIMPPIMGAGAFVMAEFLSIAYIQVAAKAALSAILYYLALAMMIHFQCLKQGLRGEPPEQLPRVRQVLPRAYLMVPVGILLYLLIVGYSPMYACVVSVISSLAVSVLRPETRPTSAKILKACVNAAQNMVSVAMALAGASVIVAAVTHTGLGLTFASLVISASQGLLFLALIFVALTAILLGMGLPTTPSYIIASALGAPALIRMGVVPFAAHLFTFYYAIISNVTPPVAVAAYAGANVARSDPMKTGYEASALAAAGYIVPFMFVYGPALILEGSPTIILWAFVTATIGVVVLAGGLQGYLLLPATWYERLLMLGAAVNLIKPGILTDTVGLFLVAVGVALQVPRLLKDRRRVQLADNM